MTGQDATPTRTRGFKKKERTRRQLIEAAVEEIAVAGEAFTILDVTKRAEVSNGTFYNYFDDRSALIDAIVSEVVTSFTDISDELVALDDPVNRFATVTALLFEQSATNPQLATVLLRLQSITAQSNTSPRDPFHHLRNDLAEAAERKRLTQEPTDAAVDLVTGMLLRAVHRITTGGATENYRREVISLLLTSLGLDEGEAETTAADAVATASELDRAYRARETT